MKKKIGLVTYSTKPRGGVVHTLELAEELHRQGEDVQVIALGDSETGFFRPINVPHVFVPAPPRADTLDERVFRSVDALAQGLSPLASRFDILHAQDCIAGRACCRVRDMGGGAPPTVVRTVHHVDDFTTQALIDCQRQSILEPDACVVVSKHWEEILATEYGVDAHVVHNGVNTKKLTSAPADFDRRAFRSRADLDGEFLFLTVGGIEPRKGTKEMIEAVALLKDRLPRPPRVAIIGGHSFQDHTPYRRAALERAAELGVSMDRDMIQLGTVSDTDLVRWYHAADAFLFPSVKEGWGLVAMEALAAGLPLIASNIPVFREYLHDGETALLVPPSQSTSLADAMQRMMEDMSLRRSLTDAGRRVVQRFTWEQAAHKHRQLYGRLSSVPRRRRPKDPNGQSLRGSQGHPERAPGSAHP